MHTPVTPISRIHSEEVRDLNRFRLTLWGALLCITLGARGALPRADEVEQFLLAKPHV